MRVVDISRIAALLSLSALLSACPKKDTDAAPEPAAAQPATVNDKAGAAAPEAPPPAKKKDDDKGGW